MTPRSEEDSEGGLKMNTNEDSEEEEEDSKAGQKVEVKMNTNEVVKEEEDNDYDKMEDKGQGGTGQIWASRCQWWRWLQ